ncbi:hypothetical protein MAF45_10555 [Mesosutterella sp. OilRF-GAM-744-9]|uniref:HTH cro/C1-type domain-containing protein n=1 Tax=Mesosutterella porci TaxID=2915351 RepID=A0ABS9MUE8_9BURK|nr:LexA family transcriptional regulator [Mesosutterella sp. oilRF-744-WT-GAM-9]MCG5031875.1 hypothetical protein [Mesosutterella sp. oilRF-744-WT-GAM-9]
MSIPINEGRAVMQKIVSLLKERNIKAAEFARLMGVQSSYVSNWKRRGIPADRLPRAADVLGVGIDVLLGRAEEVPNSAIPVVLSGHIPVVGRAQLGDDNDFADFSFYDDPDGYIRLQSKDPNAYALRCEGSSMLPRIRPGEFVVAEPSIEAMPGDEVVVQDTTSRAMVKRFLYWRDGYLYLGSVNDAYKDVIIPKQKVKSIHPVLAIVPKKLWHPH